MIYLILVVLLFCLGTGAAGAGKTVSLSTREKRVPAVVGPGPCS